MQLVTKAAQGDARAAQHTLSAIRHYEQHAETPGPNGKLGIRRR